MNERLKELSRQAGFKNWGYDEELERFADLVRQDEREACIRTCDDMAEGLVGDDVSGADGAGYCANAIRARSEE